MDAGGSSAADGLDAVDISFDFGASGEKDIELTIDDDQGISTGHQEGGTASQGPDLAAMFKKPTLAPVVLQPAVDIVLEPPTPEEMPSVGAESVLYDPVARTTSSEGGEAGSGAGGGVSVVRVGEMPDEAAAQMEAADHDFEDIDIVMTTAQRHQDDDDDEFGFEEQIPKAEKTTTVSSSNSSMTKTVTTSTSCTVKEEHSTAISKIIEQTSNIVHMSSTDQTESPPKNSVDLPEIDMSFSSSVFSSEQYATAEYQTTTSTSEMTQSHSVEGQVEPFSSILSSSVFIENGVDDPPEADLKQSANEEPVILPNTGVSSISAAEKEEDDFSFDIRPQIHSAEIVTSDAASDLPVVEPRAAASTDPVQVLTMNGLLESRKYVVEEPEKSTAQKDAEDDWEAVETITPDFQDDLPPGTKPAQGAPSPLLLYSDVVSHLQSTDLSRFKDGIKTTISRKGFAALKHKLFGPKLSSSLNAEREHIFCVAACPFLNEDNIHFQTLLTIYRRLTGSKFDPKRYGGHWEQIGFQGTDPATDLRGAGFLSVLQLLHLVSDVSTYPLARDIYRLSQHEHQNFPFCLMGINMTRIAIQSLREDILTKDCNKRKGILSLLNEFYGACYFHLYTTWKSQGKTIADTGFVLSDLETFAKKNTKTLLKNYEVHLLERRQKAGSRGEDMAGAEQPLTFTKMD